MRLVAIRADRAAQQPVAAAAVAAVYQQHGRTARADGQRGECRLDVLARQAGVGVQVADGRFHQVAAALCAHDESGADLPQLDHVGHLDHAIEQSQAGVRHVVYDAFRRQAEAMMDLAGRGRLEKVAADRAVNQRAHLPPVDSGRCEGLFGRLCALIAGQCAGGPESPLGNAGHQFQPPLRQPQPPIERPKPALDLRRTDHLFRQRVGNRFQADVLVAELHSRQFNGVRPTGKGPIVDFHIASSASNTVCGVPRLPRPQNRGILENRGTTSYTPGDLHFYRRRRRRKTKFLGETIGISESFRPLRPVTPPADTGRV